MVCCMGAKYGNWCRDLPTRTLTVDGREREYCIFHAPADQKWEDADSFNKLAFWRLKEASFKGEWCQLAGAVFPGAVDFSRFDRDNPFPSVNFTQAVFKGRVFARWCSFSGPAYFSGASFDEADFRWASFQDAYFIESIFNEKISFSGASFKGKISFAESGFGDRASFSGASFSDHAAFSGCRFDQNVDFGSASFEAADFREAVFPKADFTKASFEDAGFWGTKFTEVDFRWSRMKQAVFNMSRMGLVNFEGTDFGQAHFEWTELDKADFSRCTVYGNVRMEHANLTKASFLESDVRNFLFLRCLWPEKNGRRALFDELSGKPRELVGDLYSQLCKRSKDEGDNFAASDWHYGRMEMFRKSRTWRRLFPLSLTNLYRFSCGYGERPFRALVVLFLLLALFGAVMNYAGLTPNSPQAVEMAKEMGIENVRQIAELNPERFKLLWINSLERAVFVSEPSFAPATFAGSLATTLFTHILIPLQLFFLGLSVRNKFRR